MAFPENQSIFGSQHRLGCGQRGSISNHLLPLAHQDGVLQFHGKTIPTDGIDKIKRELGVPRFFLNEGGFHQIKEVRQWSRQHKVVRPDFGVAVCPSLPRFVCAGEVDIAPNGAFGLIAHLFVAVGQYRAGDAVRRIDENPVMCQFPQARDNRPRPAPLCGSKYAHGSKWA